MFAARLLLGEFVTGYEVSGWYGVGAPKGTPVEVIDELNKEIQGIIDRNCAWHFVTSPRRCAELDWRHPPRIGVAPWRSSSRRPSSLGGTAQETQGTVMIDKLPRPRSSLMMQPAGELSPLPRCPIKSDQERKCREKQEIASGRHDRSKRYANCSGATPGPL
jgi:hypothetical protein